MKAFATGLAIWLVFVQSSMAMPFEIKERAIEEIDKQEDMMGGSFMKPVRLAHERRSTDLDGLDSRDQDSFLYGTGEYTSLQSAFLLNHS